MDRVTLCAGVVAMALTPALPVGARAETVIFTVPSGNIRCLVVSEPLADITCEMEQRQGPPVPSFEGCGGQVEGYAISMFANGFAAGLCGRGHVPRRVGVSLPYGASMTFPGITCDSSRSGLECRNRKGSGFFLSRRSQRVW